MSERHPGPRPESMDPAAGTDSLADGAEIEDPIRSGLDDVGGTRNDAACVVPWLRAGFQAIEVYLDPLIDDRTEAICDAITTWSAERFDVDDLSEAVLAYADSEGLSASIFPQPAGEMSHGVLAVTFTAG